MNILKLLWSAQFCVSLAYALLVSSIFRICSFLRKERKSYLMMLCTHRRKSVAITAIRLQDGPFLLRVMHIWWDADSE